MAGPTTDSPELRETNDFTSMLRLAKESGLDSDHLTGVLKAYGFFVGDRMVGCAALKKVDGSYLVECVAVAADMREKCLGRTLVETIEKDARAIGARRLWAIARRPRFFERIGYHRAAPDDEGAPRNDECRKCPQFGNTCDPAIVVKDL